MDLATKSLQITTIDSSRHVLQIEQNFTDSCNLFIDDQPLKNTTIAHCY